MQFKLTSALAFVTLAAATGSPASQCNTGDLQCCASTQSATSASSLARLALLGVAVQGLTGILGVSCSPISLIELGGNFCSAQPVC